MILPKILVAIGLWWFGCKFLLASEKDADLILNAVALAFVLVSVTACVGVCVCVLCV